MIDDSQLIDAGRLGAEIGSAATIYLRPRNFRYQAYVMDADNLDRYQRAEDFTHIAHEVIEPETATEIRVVIPGFGPWYLLRDYRSEVG